MGKRNRQDMMREIDLAALDLAKARIHIEAGDLPDAFGQIEAALGSVKVVKTELEHEMIG